MKAVRDEQGAGLLYPESENLKLGFQTPGWVFGLC